jgi:hypothetical protein
MSQFPLYSSLNKNIPDKDLTLIQKKDLIEKIRINTEVHDLIYALIKTFYIDNFNGDHFALPYKGKLNEDKIDFDLDELPKKLKQLLFKFINLHAKKIDEDKNFKN